MIFYQGDAKKPCLSDANGDKIGDIVQANSNESSQASGGVQSYQINNHQQILDNMDDYSVPTSPVKSEVCIFSMCVFKNRQSFNLLKNGNFLHILICLG